MNVQELEEFFKNCQRPEMPVFLNEATKVNDFDLFLESHFGPLKSNPESKINKPLLARLKMMKLIIEAN